MSSFGNQGAGFYAGTNWGNPYGGRYYSPSGRVTGSTGLKGGTSPLDAVAELAYASQSGGDTIGSYGGDGPSTGGGRSQGAGPAMGALTSMGVGYLGSQAGLPGYVTGPLGSFAGKAVGKGEITEHDLATVSLVTAAKAAAPALFANPAVALGLGVAGLFGFNPFSALVDRLAREFSITDLMSDQARAGYVSDMLGVSLADQRGISFDDYGNAMMTGPTLGFDEGDLGGGLSVNSQGPGVSVSGPGVNSLGTIGGLQGVMTGAFPGLDVSISEEAFTDPSDPSEQGDDEAAPGLDSAATAADGGFSDGGFSDGQAGDPWKNGGLVQYSEWKKRRC